MTRRYTIDVSEEQLGVILRALDVYSRIGMGQLEVAVWETVRDLFRKPDDAEYLWGRVREHVDWIKWIVWGHEASGSYGIFSHNVPAECREAHDILQVCRKVRADARGGDEWSVDRCDYMPAHPEWPPVLCTVYDPAPASPADPLPAGNPAAPGPSLAGLERAAGEGGVRVGIAAAREEVDAARRWWAAAVGIATTDEEANRDRTVADALAVVVAKIDALDPEIIADAD